ncbi:MAG: carbon-nitrogen hydrolase family protein [Spirochaetia bacterium]|jgi:predicted amidohydrolase
MTPTTQTVDNRTPANLIAGEPKDSSKLPAGWEASAPNPVLSPRFGCDADSAGRTRLSAEGNGRPECFGFLFRQVSLEAGKTYRLYVHFQTENLGDVNRHLVHGVFARPMNRFNEGVFRYRQAPDGIQGERIFRGPTEAMEVEVRLIFRFSAHGRVWWDCVSLEECEPIPPRPVRIACSWGNGDLAHWAGWLDAAGRRGVDVALLPETFSGVDPAKAQPLDGEAPSLLSEKARQWHMYVSGSFYERRRDIVLNTAPLYDRSGVLVGTYSKNQLYDPELSQGVTPGRGFPVFRTDFGVVGIIICYDSWFPETVRLLAYKGADLVLFPNVDYYLDLMPARAADNGVWLATSSSKGPAGVWDPSGSRAGELAPEQTRYAACSLRAVERDEEQHVLVTTVDMSQRYSPHWWGGPMLSAPGGRRVRQTLMQPIEDEIAAEAARWCERDAGI